MSIWTSNLGRAVGIFRIPTVALTLFLPLSACLDAGGFGSNSQNRPSALSEVAFFDGRVVVAGPDGYCIDAKSIKKRSGSSFALLASCARLSDSPAEYVEPMVITVSVLGFDANVTPPTARDIANSMAPAKAIQEINREGVSLVHMAQGGDKDVPGGDPRYWRAGLMINGHLVGLAAYAEKDGPLAGPKGRNLLIEMAKVMRRKSPILATPAAQGAGATPENPSDTATQPKPKGIKAIFPGLFPNPA